MALPGRGCALKQRSSPYSRRILDDRAMRGLYPCPIEGASFQCLFSYRGLLVRGRSQQFFVNGGGLTTWKQIRRRELIRRGKFHVAPVLRRVWCCGGREHHRCHRDGSHDKARPEPFLASMAMAKCAEIAKKPPLKMASKSPAVGGYTGEGWGVPHCFA